MSSLNFLDTPHPSASHSAMGFSTSFDQAFSGASASGNGRALPPSGSPAADFKNNIQLALTQHLPQLMALAEAVVDGIDRAYELDVNPNKTANDCASLALLTSQFYDFLRETGIGALPMTDMESTSAITTTTSTGHADAMALDLVATVSIQTSNAMSKMSEDELRTSLDSAVNAQYLRERRVADNASIVLNRLSK